MDDDSSVTGESSDDDPVENKATVNIGKMHFIESIGQTIESIEKEMEELDLQLTKVTCPVIQRIIDCHKNLLISFRESMQKRLEGMKHGVQQGKESLKEDIQTLTDLKIEISTDEKKDNLMTEHGDLQVEETTTDENLKKDSAGISPLGGAFPKQGQEGKCMLDLKQDSSPIAEKEMKKSDDDKQLSINGSTVAEIKRQKTQDALVTGNFDELTKLLDVNHAKATGLKKDELGDVDADLKGGTSPLIATSRAILEMRRWKTSEV
ncbi:hypothetical protein HAX54_034782 [Datura stramonium]|uniref:Uncharacterized protein n=1 Tax=Datura stramonium TaxID=4076 RepID=A0ABS8SFE3_DATST|nr:hypothetical protein [Datura stramonium]